MRRSIPTKDAEGRYRRVWVTELDFEAITRTLTTIRAWLESAPTSEDVEAEIAYEKANSNRSGAVGSSGSLIEYLETK